MTMTVPTLETARLILRPMTLEWVTDYEKHFIDYEVISQLSAAVPWPYPKDGVRNWLSGVALPAQGNGRWTWALFLKSHPQELIGSVELWRPGTPENRGFWLGRKYWGQGLMTEAVTPVMDYAFSALGFERLVFANALGNLRSRRIKEKTGATLLGVRPGGYVNPAYSEQEVWELTKENWLKAKP